MEYILYGALLALFIGAVALSSRSSRKARAAGRGTDGDSEDRPWPSWSARQDASASTSQATPPTLPDRQRRQASADQSLDESVHSQVSELVSSFSIHVSYGGTASIDGAPSTSDECWIAPGDATLVGSRRIPGGMLYIGKQLPTVSYSYRVEPALIDPALSRQDRSPERSGESMGYWPCYSSIPPACRSGYLDWLEGGRVDPQAGIGYVFLFFYGLERRVLHDAQLDAGVHDEFPAIRTEVERLLSIYSESRSFQSYASGFLATLAALDPEGLPPYEATAEYGRSRSIPLDLRCAIAAEVLHRESLSTALAFAWATNDPTISLRTPALRCRDEFRELFHTRFDAKYPSGLRIPVCKRKIRVEYRPASASFGGMFTAPTDLPNITALVRPQREIAGLVEECMTALDPFSRKLGREATAESRLAAAALLPRDILATHAPAEVLQLAGAVADEIATESHALLDASRVLGPWLPKDGSKQAKKDAVAAATMLGTLGIGIEPDVRFGGTRLSLDDCVVAFRLDATDANAPSAAYVSASLLLHLAAVTAAADGEVSDDERRVLLGRVDSSTSLDPGERRRLAAHVEWLLSSPPSIAGVKKRLESVTAEKKAAIGRFLALVTLADGRVDADEVKSLTKSYKLLGLDPGSVHVELHALQAESRPTDTPISVRSARPSAPGVPIPPRDEEPLKSEPQSSLDMSLVASKLQESASVSAMLSSIFEDEEEPPTSESGQTSALDAVALEGQLDSAHRSMLQQLSQRSRWSRDEFDTIADRLELMPDGALDAINDAAWDTCDEPAIEDGVELEINQTVCQQLLAT